MTEKIHFNDGSTKLKAGSGIFDPLPPPMIKMKTKKIFFSKNLRENRVNQLKMDEM